MHELYMNYAYLFDADGVFTECLHYLGSAAPVINVVAEVEVDILTPGVDFIAGWKTTT